MSKKNSKPDALNIVARALDAMQDGEQKAVIVLHPDRMIDSILKSIDELIKKEESILEEIAEAKKFADRFLKRFGSENSSTIEYKAMEDALREASVERLKQIRDQRKKYEAILNRLMDAAIKRLEQE